MAQRWSVDEIAAARAKVNFICDGFAIEYEHAPRDVQALIRTCGDFSRVLTDLEFVLMQYNEFYPQQNVFTKILDECDSFLRRYRSLQSEFDDVDRRSSSGSGAISWTQRWQSPHFSYYLDSARDLTDRLSLEIQMFTTFILLLALKQGNFPVGETHYRPFHGSHLRSQSALRVIPEDPLRIVSLTPPSFQQIFSSFVTLKYRYDRQMNPASVNRQSTSGNLSKIQQELQDYWQDLCARYNIIGREGSTPPLPSPGIQLLQGLSANFNDLVVSMAEPSIHGRFRTNTDIRSFIPEPPPRPASIRSPVHSPMHSPELPSRSPAVSVWSSRERVSSPEFRGPFITPESAAHSGGHRGSGSFTTLRLPSAEFGSTISLMPRSSSEVSKLELLGLNVLPVNETARCLEWKIQDSAEKLQHFIPDAKNIFPYVSHSDISGSMGVTFHGFQRVSYSSSNGQFDEECRVMYSFVDEPTRDHFQGEIREKELVHSSNFDILWTNQHRRTDGMGRPEGLAAIGKVTIWRQLGWPYKHSISFFDSLPIENSTSISDPRHFREFVLKDFSDSPSLETHNIVHMKLGPRTRPDASNGRRRNSLKTLFQRSSSKDKNSKSPTSPIGSGFPDPLHGLSDIFIQFSAPRSDSHRGRPRPARRRTSFSSESSAERNVVDHRQFMRDFQHAWDADLISHTPPYPTNKVEVPYNPAPFEMYGGPPSPKEVLGSTSFR